MQTSVKRKVQRDKCETSKRGLNGAVMQHDDGHRGDLRFGTDSSPQSRHPPFAPRLKHQRSGGAAADGTAGPQHGPAALLPKPALLWRMGSCKQVKRWSVEYVTAEVHGLQSPTIPKTAVRKGGDQSPSSLNFSPMDAKTQHKKTYFYSKL